MTDDILESAVDFVFGGTIGLMSWFFGGRDRGREEKLQRISQG